MRVAFYAPLKPPMHPVPSGDRRVARLLMDALAEGGHAVELVSRFRSWDGAGDGARQARLREVGARLAKRLARRLLNRPAHLQPELWFTYHLYHKAPDWLGPPVSAELGIPYVVAEASVADKQADGPWAEGHAASIEALRRADAVFELNPADEPGVRPHLPGPGRLHPLPPFLDIAPYAEARRARLCYRDSFADELDLPKDEPWLLAVAMMRPGDKLASYRALAAALGRVAERSWRLLDTMPLLQPGDTVSFAVEVIDRTGENAEDAAARSEVRRLKIVSLAEYQRIVMDQLGQVRRRLQSARQQEAEAAENLDALHRQGGGP